MCPACILYSTKVFSVAERRGHRKLVTFAGVLMIPLNIQPKLLITNDIDTQKYATVHAIPSHLSIMWELGNY